jgi:wyosine [tRNA(Phe)-imidazoG37] synthetase (radical SAM superfamily)
MPAETSPAADTPLFHQHSRQFAANRFVYPVVSRRSGGLSIGVNLNPDKICNFDCIYCQVDRTRHSETQFVEMPQLLAELDAMLAWCLSGEVFRSEAFRTTPPALQRVNDIAFSGDGEPTTYRNFDDIVAACADLKQRHAAADVKMVLITNASMFHRPHVQRGLEILDANQGEIWAKLETGTEAYYRLVERTTVPFRRVLQNIAEAARRRPIVLQSLFMRIHGQPPPHEELLAYCERINDIVASGGQIRLVQVYTVARRPAESFVAPLSNDEVDAIAALVRQQCGITAVPYYGGTDW